MTRTTRWMDVNRVGLALAVLALAAGGWLIVHPEAAAAPEGGWIRTELYFGMNRPDGTVSEEQWRAFLADEITALFPEGLTVHQVHGQFRTAMGEQVKEATRVVVIVHAADAPTTGKIEQIRTAYRNRFDQESVLWVSQPCEVAF